MNENKDQFGLDSIKPLEPVTPIPEMEQPSTVFETADFTFQPKVEEASTQYAFTSESNVVDPVVPEFSEPAIMDTEEVSSVDNTDTLSYTEMSPVTDEEISTLDTVNEHPDAKISLRREMETEIPVHSNLPEEKVDKSTMWMLIWLFVGMLIVIIALPYLFELF